MDIDIRKHITNNFKGDNTEDLRKAIEESIQENDELTLPGMGVFLELIWQGADEELQNKMLNIVKSQINSDTEHSEKNNCNNENCNCENCDCNKEYEADEDKKSDQSQKENENEK